MWIARRCDTGRLACCRPDEGLRAQHRIRRDAIPNGAPQKMRACKHGLRGDFRKGFWEYLHRRRLAAEQETVRTGATHAECVPDMGLLEPVLIFQEDGHHLIGRGGILVGARGDEDGVRIAAVGNDGGVLLQPADVSFDLNRADGIAQIAADSAFGRGRGEQKLFACNAAHETRMPWACLAVFHKARCLDVVHGENHRGCRTGWPSRAQISAICCMDAPSPPREDGT